MIKYLRIVFFLITSSFIALGQSVDLENLGKRKLLKIGGGVAANAMFSKSNQEKGGESITWSTTGNLNINVLGFNVPLTFSYSNRGSKLGYELPFNINYLSLHPTYKWITAHIGKASMNFSPNTFNGHEFTGVGIELSPPGSIKFSAMYGRLLKAVEDNGNRETIPSFKRMGYGAKVNYEKDRFNATLIGFYAKDDANSIGAVSEDKGITPKENLVIGIGLGVDITDNLNLEIDYSSTAITNDIRSPRESKSGGSIAGLFLPNRGTTDFFGAIKTLLNYQIKKVNFGISYERIDPGYETLGAHYFNKDFENIVFNASSPFLQDELDISLEIGTQRDNLDGTKQATSKKLVGSINANYRPNERLSISSSYSNFQSFTNSKLDQFETINDNNTLDNDVDSLRFRQINQTGTLNLGYILKDTEKSSHNLMFDYSINIAANEENGIIRIGNLSTFHNFSAGYDVEYLKNAFNISALMNYTINTIGRENSTTWGPSLSIGKQFFKDKLNTSFGATYNQNKNEESTSNSVNLKLNSSYVLKKRHNFNLGVVQSFRYGGKSEELNELTATFGYSYSFDLHIKKKKSKKTKKKKIEKRLISISFNGKKLNGTSEDINEQILETVFKIMPHINKDLQRKLYDQFNFVNQSVFDAYNLPRKKYRKKKKTFKKAVSKLSKTFAKTNKLYEDYKKILWESVINIKNKENKLLYKGRINTDNENALDFRTLKKMIPEEWLNNGSRNNDFVELKKRLEDKEDSKKLEYSTAYMLRELDRIEDESKFLESVAYKELKEVLMDVYSKNRKKDINFIKEIIIHRIIYYYYYKLKD